MRRNLRVLWAGWLAGALGLAGGATTVAAARAQVPAAPPAAAAAPVLVYAAASLTDALGEVARAFSAPGRVGADGTAQGIPIKTSFAASSLLAKQIEAGAPAQVYVSADAQWMDYLESRHLIKAGTRHDLLANRLVLIAPVDSPVHVTLRHGVDFEDALQGGRLATGDPDSVPVGRYARAALTWLGVWDRVSPRLVRAENVRAALEYVARGEAALGIVYQTDALIEKRVRVVQVFPAESHPPIVYPVALTTQASAEAARFEAFLSSETARQIFVRYGFELPPQPALTLKTP